MKKINLKLNMKLLIFLIILSMIGTFFEFLDCFCLT